MLMAILIYAYVHFFSDVFSSSYHYADQIQNLEASNEKILTDSDEGVSLCVMLSNLQRVKGEIKCSIELKHRDDVGNVVARADAVLGHLLITRIFA
uniref:Uncharacterized protein n=1 Tax=Ascaris lumbricoides TaxID=6252 RepID=A0A0M3IES1_ASCLU